MNVKFAFSSHQGGRDEQQDHVQVFTGPNDRLLVVADGMGGHVGGQIASRAVVETAHELWQDWDRASVGPDDLIRRIIVTAHATINQLGEERGIQPRSTCVILYLDDARAVWGHIGDSRLYRFAAGRVVERTRDHSVPQMLLDMGKITEEEVATHPDQNRLTQSLGGENDPEPEIGQAVLQAGDAFLLCSDGLWERVTPERMAEALYGDDLNQVVARLPQEAYEVETHSSDNISVAVATVDVTPGAIAAVPGGEVAVAAPAVAASPPAATASRDRAAAHPAAPPPRGRTKMIVGSLVALLVLGGAGVYAAVTMTGTSPPTAAGGDLDKDDGSAGDDDNKAPSGGSTDQGPGGTKPKVAAPPKKQAPVTPPTAPRRSAPDDGSLPPRDRVQQPPQRRTSLPPDKPTPAKPRKPDRTLPRDGWFPGLFVTPADGRKARTRDLDGRKRSGTAPAAAPRRAKPASGYADDDKKAKTDGKKAIDPAKTGDTGKSDKKNQGEPDDAFGWSGATGLAP